VHSRATQGYRFRRKQRPVQVQEVPKEPVSEWKWRMLVEFYSLIIPYYVLTSSKITNAKANVADRIISNDLVNLKVF
jgi:hypothetical protein